MNLTLAARMLTLYSFTSPPSPCSYLPERRASLRYDIVHDLTPEEYQRRLQNGWRRFGYSLFRPECQSCTACLSIRVDPQMFRPSQTQKRVAKLNEGIVELTIGEPSVTREKLRLYDKFHAFQSDFKNWPEHGPKSANEYAEGFVDNPFPTYEWCYRVDGRLIGVGYVDHLPAGLSAIYFFYDPDERPRSPGVWNVLSVLRHAAKERIPYVYLGFYVEGCRSLDYKAKYRPNEVLHPDGKWRLFLE